MKKIVGVEFKDSKIIFKIENKFLFSKKEYEENIDISKICQIEKILESASHDEFTCIVFHQNVTEIDGINIDTLDNETLDDEVVKEIINEKSILYEIPAYRYTGEIPKLFDELIKNLDMSKIEVVETII